MARPAVARATPTPRGRSSTPPAPSSSSTATTPTTIRSVARRAQVDPALVYHYFTDKATLYASTLCLPADPQQIMRDVQASPILAGRRLVEGFLAQWETVSEDPGKPS